MGFRFVNISRFQPVAFRLKSTICGLFLLLFTCQCNDNRVLLDIPIRVVTVFFIFPRWSRVRIPQPVLESLRNSFQQGIFTHLLQVDSAQPSPCEQAKLRSSSALQQQLTRSLGPLAPSPGTCSVSWCQSEDYRKGRSAPNRMGFAEPKGYSVVMN